jgi:hypothetical protein
VSENKRQCSDVTATGKIRYANLCGVDAFRAYRSKNKHRDADTTGAWPENCDPVPA